MAGILSDIDGDMAGDSARRRKPNWPDQPAPVGLLVRHRSSGYVGKIRRFSTTWVTMIDQDGREQRLRTEAGAFSVEGRTVNLVPPKRQADEQTSFTASGSVAIADFAARVALPSRILVEGIHDAELVEKVWGDDLRIEGVVVEPLHGADDLAEVVNQFGPTPTRRLGILLDHLVDGSKESRIANSVVNPFVMIAGHPYVDVWQAVRPKVLGIEAWPTIPMGTDWKTGICAAFNFSGSSGQLWKKILAQVNGYADLEPGLVGAVEQLIDFVTEPVGR